MHDATSDHARCAAARGADSAARRPYHRGNKRLQSPNRCFKVFATNPFMSTNRPGISEEAPFVPGLWLILLIVWLFSHSYPCIAQEPGTRSPYYTQVWTADDALPENRVVGITQTADGYLWVLTRGGLVRFDGVEFQPFEGVSSAGFTTSTMWNLYQDPGAGCGWPKSTGPLFVSRERIYSR